MTETRDRFEWPVPPPTFNQLEVVCGPMWSGKTSQLFERLKTAELSGLRVALFRPRVSEVVEGIIRSHAGGSAPAVSLSSPDQLRRRDVPLDLALIDEAQFFDPWIVDVVAHLCASGVRVVVGGLDLDFGGRPFGSMPDLLAMADHVTKLRAVCGTCGSWEATRTQRLIDGSPAGESDPIIVVEGTVDGVTYEPRCVRHWSPLTQDASA
jgi:thymidine kinase